jgi:hydrogenase maturation protease
MKTVVIGLGNPILGDDGVGWRVAEAFKQLLLAHPFSYQVEVDCLSVGGLSLMERLIGADRAIIIDAVSLKGKLQGEVSVFELEQLPDLAAGHITSAHDTSLPNAIQVGRSMGAHLPERVTVVGVQAHNLFEFSEELSPPVAEAVPRATQAVIHLLQADEELKSSGASAFSPEQDNRDQEGNDAHDDRAP